MPRPLPFHSHRPPAPSTCSHANRPQLGRSDDPNGSILYTIAETGHRIANERQASWVAVTSDPLQEDEAWMKARGFESFKPIRVPPFSEEEARQLLVRLIFEKMVLRDTYGAQPRDASTPTTTQLAEVESK